MEQQVPWPRDTENLKQSWEIWSIVSDCGLWQKNAARLHSGYLLYKASLHLMQPQKKSYKAAFKLQSQRKDTARGNAHCFCGSCHTFRTEYFALLGTWIPVRAFKMVWFWLTLIYFVTTYSKLQNLPERTTCKKFSWRSVLLKWATNPLKISII